MSILEDVRLILRGLRHAPAFTAVAVATLALGIGPNVAIFSAIHGLLLRPLPFRDADRLVRIESVRGGEPGSISYRESRDMTAMTSVFEDVALYTDQGQYNASGDGRPEELVSTITTQNLFSVLGVPLLFGAPWPELLDRTRDFKLVISYDLWQRRFGGDRDVLGKTLTLDGSPGYSILGVLPRGFAFPIRSDLYRSHGIAAAPDQYEDRSVRGKWGIGRMKPGVTTERLNAALVELGRRNAAEHPQTNASISYRATPLRDLYVGSARPYLLLVLGAVALVLLVACSNVANLMLARLAGRDREIAVRLALGAPRSSVRRLILLEGVVIAVLGAIPGIGLAIVGTRLLTTLVRADLPIWMSIELSYSSLAFAVAVTLIIGSLTALVPAMRAGRGDLTPALRSGGRGAAGGVGQRRFRNALVIGELALAVMLLVGAGLMVRSFRSLTRLSPGFSSDSLLVFRVELGWRAYPGNTSIAFHRDLLGRLAQLPGVQSAALISSLPLDGRPRGDRVITLDGQSTDEQRANPYLNVRVTSPTLLSALRIPLERGRFFTSADRDSVQRVAVVSRATARRLWPNRDPLGARLMLGTGDSTKTPWLTVVGVVGDVKHERLDGPASLDVYLPYEQTGAGSAYFLLRTSNDPMALARSAPSLVWQIDPNQSFFDVRPMHDRVADRVWVPRLAGVLFTGFAALASALGAIGVFAVLAYAVSQRTRELGVRQALGASPSDLARLVLREGMTLAGTGTALGLAGALVIAALLRHLLFGVSPFDIPTLIAAPTLLLAVAATACWIPGRRATHIPPADALRSDG